MFVVRKRQQTAVGIHSTNNSRSASSNVQLDQLTFGSAVFVCHTKQLSGVGLIRAVVADVGQTVFVKVGTGGAAILAAYAALRAIVAHNGVITDHEITRRAGL